MFSELNTYLQTQGLESITILFSIHYQYHHAGWQPVAEQPGPVIYKTLQQFNPSVLQEVESIHYYHHSNLYNEIAYALHIPGYELDSLAKLRKTLYFLIGLKKEYQPVQIFINNVFQVDEKALLLEDYLRTLQ